MDTTEIKHVIEAAMLAARRPLTLDKLGELFSSRGTKLENQEIRTAIDALAQDYSGRGVELKEVASGFRIQVRRTMSDWLMPLWEERAPRYTRALLETLALIAYRQPITRGEIEEVRGVAVSTNIVRTLMERGWVRVVGHRDVPGKPAMFGTTREFLDYFGLKRLDSLPPLAEIKDWTPEESPQTDLVESLRDVADMMSLSDSVQQTVEPPAAREVPGAGEAQESTKAGTDAGPTEPEEADSQADQQADQQTSHTAQESTVTRTGSD